MKPDIENMKNLQQRILPPLAVSLALSLAGCGGGSGGMNGDANPMEMPEMPEAPETVAIPSTMHEGSPEPRYADSADTLDSMTGTTFSTLSAPLVRWGENANVALSEASGAYVDSITWDAEGGAMVVFVIDGQEQAVQFTQDEFESFEEDAYKVIGSRTYLTEPATFSSSNPLDRTWFDVFFWETWTDDGSDSHTEAVYGLRTRPENLPMGAASYDGFMVGRFFGNDGNSPRWRTHRRLLWGEMGLEANFDQSTISGQVDGIWFQDTRENDNAWEELPDTTTVTITGGNIVGGRFTADWAGQDTDPDNPATTSVRGFEGDIVGDFYGPAAEEVAGVFNGRRDATDTTPEQFITGMIGGQREEE